MAIISIMEKNNIWSDFQMSKAKIIKYALEKENDTLFLDCDIIITNIINDIDNTKELGVSPQFIKKVVLDEYGFYNGGVLWVKQVIPFCAKAWVLFFK